MGKRSGPHYRCYVCSDCKEYGSAPCFIETDGPLAPTVCAFTFRIARWGRRA